MPLCTGHCMLEDLLQVCPNDVLRKMKGEMEESGYTFSKPVCKEEQRSSDCLSVQTTMFSFAVAGITTTQGELSSRYHKASIPECHHQYACYSSG